MVEIIYQGLLYIPGKMAPVVGMGPPLECGIGLDKLFFFSTHYSIL